MPPNGALSNNRNVLAHRALSSVDTTECDLDIHVSNSSRDL